MHVTVCVGGGILVSRPSIRWSFRSADLKGALEGLSGEHRRLMDQKCKAKVPEYKTVLRPGGGEGTVNWG
jgi:hypothetical protein